MILAPDQKLRLPSKAENLILVERMVEDVCDIFSIGEEKFGNIIISVTEAVNNAIVHGNKSNPSKNFDISFRSSPTDITFVVKDEGNGFDAASLPDPTAPENIEKDNGRGVFLMKRLADKVDFEDGGRTVILRFNLMN
ncbi:MAG: serine/threonine protein kinase [Bacteroidetes bacterium]|jgi:serine/threonine-protein kinase RsbW|nr:serine/threonine protein kinase [Bacteroidota bacterium]